MRKAVFIFLSLGALLILALKIDFQGVKQDGCPFCRAEILEAQTFYKGPLVLGLLTHKPATPGHVLIIPERHVERFEDLSSEEVAALGVAIQKIDRVVREKFGNKDYILIQKNGKEAGQSVPHVHFHYLPATDFLAAKFLFSAWLKPQSLEEIRLAKEILSESF